MEDEELPKEHKKQDKKGGVKPGRSSIPVVKE
jgi:hypothetical protein